MTSALRARIAATGRDPDTPRTWGRVITIEPFAYVVEQADGQTVRHVKPFNALRAGDQVVFV